MCIRRFLLLSPVLFLLGLVPLLLHSADDLPKLNNPGPLEPAAEQKTFRTLPGFKVELAASEPNVVDPVALTFDERGRLFVGEMRGYPNAGVGTGDITSGRIRLLEDRDGDGVFETSTLFAEGLRLPTSVMPWKGGLLVCNAPEIIYLEDTDGDGKADRRRVLYTGFDLGNIQQMVNSLQWGLDNWVHGCAGGKGGEIRSAEKPDTPAVTLRGRGIRFKPDVPGSLEPTSGGGQFGLTSDEYGRWFTATNSQHLRHIILPDQYLRRNPQLPVGAVTLDIPEHGGACKVYRISPFEAWRVERTTRRKGGKDFRRFPTTELVPGGFATSACSPLAYTADLFPPRYRGSILICDPANNAILRDVLTPKGATYIAKRGDAEQEFLASTDNWFRPVWLTLGPDGAVYVADFYREVIETPISLPEDIRNRLNLESRGRGRIWRITTPDAKRSPLPNLSKATTAELVRLLTNPNSWYRFTAQRLLVERQDKAAIPLLQPADSETTFAPGRVHLLWTLEGLGGLTNARLVRALSDPEAGVREQALKLAEARLDNSVIRNAVLKRTNDDSPRVRFQLAFTLGAHVDNRTASALAEVLRRDVGDPWTVTAALSSAHGPMAPLLLAALRQHPEFVGSASGQQLLARLAGLIGAGGDAEQLAAALELLTVPAGQKVQPWQLTLLEGLGKGLQQGKGSFDKLWSNPPAKLKQGLGRCESLFAWAVSAARGKQTALADRLTGIRLLGIGPYQYAADVLPELLQPTEAQAIQVAAVQAMSAQNYAPFNRTLLASWGSQSPEVRKEVLTAVFSRPERVRLLLDAVEQKQIQPGQLEPTRLQQLRTYPDAGIRTRVQKLLASVVVPARAKVLQAYQKALELQPNTTNGKAIFKKICANCHRLQDLGHEVGPDLKAVVPGKTPDYLLISILDPSREVDPRYIEYQVTTTVGKVATGMIAAETATSVTLRRAEKVEEVILRSQIESIQATPRSLMPDGLEMQIAPQDVADVIGYLLEATRK